MRLLPVLPLLLAAPAWAAERPGSSLGTVTTLPSASEALPTGSYLTYTTTYTIPTTRLDDLDPPTATASDAGNGTATGVLTTTSASFTLLVGGQGTTTLAGDNATATANASVSPSTTSSASPLPTNTRPCNGYPEFCNRNYSNITMVAAHNSPFAVPRNWASNQALPVTTQLNDGIRMLQFQTHWENNTLWLCHTSCDILNVGTLESYLTAVVQWLRENPYDVLTILMGNSDFIGPGNYTAPIVNSGLVDFVYTPHKIPMGLHDWPTLGSMILTGKRVVVFLDYQANQTEVPYILDEFSQMWETPFSPTDRNFPCTVQRPPNLPPSQAMDRMYMANHNLNLEISFAGLNILVPNTVLLNETNAVSGYGSLGWMAENCTKMWNRPPNFLLVDYYNYGNFNGSVFEVAAMMNGVKYNGRCCGSSTTSAAPTLPSEGRLTRAVVVAFLVSLAGAFL